MAVDDSTVDDWLWEHAFLVGFVVSSDEVPSTAWDVSVSARDWEIPVFVATDGSFNSD